MRRSEWEACRAAGAVGAQLPEGGFLHCSPVEYFWRVAPGHYADGGDYVLLCIDVKKVPAPIKWEAGPITQAGITRTFTARAPWRP